MFKRVLIANRGEIAVRIARTCRALGIQTVAVYSDADRRALHVMEADRAVHIGPSPPSASYLKIKAIVRAAKEAGADAIHPGYGLLAENPDFAQACADAGIVFIGPSPNAMRAMGDKAAARRLVASLSVPVIPGYDSVDSDPTLLQSRAQEIGFPIMVKAAAGGGGRGMRLVHAPERLTEALDSARREAERAFGDGRLILERAIVGARHIEVQVFADHHGHTVHLGERDCSAQRRHQKVIEESPAPAVDPDLRGRLGHAAVEVARAVGYTNAGTVEFLLDADRNFYFMEMNTRLQVEHGVTEMVTGLDLVALQLTIAAGEPLPFTQDQVHLSGHAIECRIYAEDPLKGYRPSPGRITLLQLPSGQGVRNDVGTYRGDEVTTYYDPMLAKVLTHGRDRTEAIQRMERALATYRVEGVRTNLPLLRGLISHPTFRTGAVTTDFLETQLSPEALVPSAGDEALFAAFAAVALGIGAGPNPWHIAGPLRPGGVLSFALRHETAIHQIEAQRLPGAWNEWNVNIGDRFTRLRATATGPDGVLLEWEGKASHATIRRTDYGLEVETGGCVFPFHWSVGPKHGPSSSVHHQQGLTAPMPGLVLKVLVRPGQRVRAHQTLVVIEAMKMEHAIEAPHDGIVRKVHCAEGGRVSEGAPLIELDKEAPA